MGAVTTYRAVLSAAALVVTGFAPVGLAAAAEAETGIEDACPPDTVPPTWFGDISENAHEQAIECVAWQRIALGISPTAYRPDLPLTRGQMATFLARMLERAGMELPEPAGDSFSDSADTVHSDAIDQITQVGIAKGRDDGTYGPHDPVLRGQMATFVVRAIELVAGEELPDGDARFEDTEGHAHEENILAAAAAGIVRGVTESRYEPARVVQRDQMGSFIARGLSWLIEAGHAEPYTDPPYTARVEPLPDDLRTWMTGRSWREGCPVDLDDLRLVTVTHWDFGGDLREGRLVVHHDVSADVVDAFAALYISRFRVERMRLVDHYDGDDDLSMADNNSSAFNCRPTTGGTGWSEHAYGRAIDLNPVQNPYVRGSRVEPPAGGQYLDRNNLRLGMIVDGDPVVDSFARIGWGWGGHWSSLKDYMHFSATGR